MIVYLWNEVLLFDFFIKFRMGIEIYTLIITLTLGSYLGRYFLFFVLSSI